MRFISILRAIERRPNEVLVFNMQTVQLPLCVGEKKVRVVGPATVTLSFCLPLGKMSTTTILNYNFLAVTLIQMYLVTQP